MSKPSKTAAPEVEIKKSAATGESEPKFLTKSDYPKTPKQTIKMVVNFFLNFFPF
jgi:hypothetical protein